MKLNRGTAHRLFPPNVGSLVLAALSMGMRDEAPAVVEEEKETEPMQMELADYMGRL